MPEKKGDPDDQTLADRETATERYSLGEFPEKPLLNEAGVATGEARGNQEEITRLDEEIKQGLKERKGVFPTGSTTTKEVQDRADARKFPWLMEGQPLKDRISAARKTLQESQDANRTGTPRPEMTNEQSDTFRVLILASEIADMALSQDQLSQLLNLSDTSQANQNLSSIVGESVLQRHVSILRRITELDSKQALKMCLDRQFGLFS